MALYLGCPMWALKSWPGPFFASGTKPRDFLASYSRRLNTVEGNTTFYALPDPAKVARWRDETPPGFRFCLKFPQAISHQRKLSGAQGDTDAFVDRLRLLEGRRGPAFLQLPPSFGARMLPALDAYLAALPVDLQIAVEPRHADFFGPAEAEFDALLRAHRAARGVFDTSALFALPAGVSGSDSAAVRAAQERKPRFATRTTRTAAFSFVRFVGQPGRGANRPWREPGALHAAAWLAAGDDCYFFFHRPDDTEAPALAREFHELLSARIALDPLPEFGDGEPLQGTLF